MASNKRELVLALVSDSSQFNRGLDQAEGKIKSFGKSAENTAKNGGLGKLDTRIGAVRASLGGLAAATGGLFAANKIGQFAKDSLAAFSNLEESANALRVVFGNAAEPLEKFARTAAQSVGLAASEFNQLAATTGALLQNFGLSASEAADETLNLTQRAADLASVYNTSVPDALEAVNAALRGEQEPIRRYAINIDDAAARTKAFELGLATSAGSADLNARAQGRLALIMEQSNKVAGDFVNTSDSLANAQKIAASEAENLKAVIGEQLAPEYAKLIDLGAELRRSAAVLTLDFLADANTPVEKARKALATFTIQTGAATDSAAALATLVLDLEEGLEGLDKEGKGGGLGDRAETIKELARQSGIAIPEIDRLAGNLQYLQDTFGLSASDAQLLSDALIQVKQEAQATQDDVRLIANANRDLGFDKSAAEAKKASDAYNEHRTEALRLRDQLRGLEKAQRAATEAFLAAADPAFAAASAMGRLRDAESELADVRKDGESSAIDVAEAELAVAEARLGVQSALDALDDASLYKVFETLAAAMGTSTDEARTLLETLGLLDGTTVNTVVNTTFTTTGSAPAGSKAGGGGGLIGAKAAGGPVEAGSAYLVGEKGPELFTPNQNGRIIPNNQIGSGGGITVNQTFERVTGENVAEDIQKGLLISGLSRYAEVG